MSLYRECLSSSSSAKEGVSKYIKTISSRYPSHRPTASQSVVKITWRLMYMSGGQMAFSALLLVFGRIGYARTIVTFTSFHLVPKEEAGDFKTYAARKKMLLPLAKVVGVFAGVAAGLSGVVLALLLLSHSDKPPAPGVIPNTITFFVVSALILGLVILGRHQMSSWCQPADTGTDFEDSSISVQSVEVID